LKFYLKIRVKVIVNEDCIASIIGRGGININEIEKFLKVHIDIVAKDSELLSLTSHDLPLVFQNPKLLYFLLLIEDTHLCMLIFTQMINFLHPSKLVKKDK
jgi:ATPase, PilT family